MENTIKVDVQNGVYLDKEGTYIVCEVGEVQGELAVKLTGPDQDGNEVSVVKLINDSAVTVAVLLSSCEYLGEL